MHQDGTLVGTFVVSIDLPNQRQAVLADRSLSVRVAELLRKRRIPATWALSQPDSAACAERIRNSLAEHEIALLCEGDWVGNEAGRTVFARQLTHRLGAAKQAGVRVTTLALRSDNLTQNLDLLVKHRVSVIRGRLDQPSRDESFQPQSVRFGVWHAPVSRVLPRRGWVLPATRWMWRQTIRRVCQQFNFMHLAVDFAALTGGDMKNIELALQAAAQMREEGWLRIQTLQQVSQRLIRRRQRPPARSVLHVA